MKKFIILLLLFQALAAAAPGTDALVRSIRKECKKVLSEKKHYTTVDSVLVGDTVILTTDGVDLTGYYYKGELKLIKEICLGESRQVQTDYYFKDNSLIFILETITIYNVPYYEDKFNWKKRKIQKNRYYFNGGKLIRMTSSYRKTKNIPQAELDAIARLLIREMEYIMQFIKSSLYPKI